ncbi:MAG TPA: DUF3857 and transglutaminase domain-containing protein [Ohtaekwangia sp.]|nr:DUF3857 and transglutaminase domain-containing protein [Ohtaekwangia sp.]
MKLVFTLFFLMAGIAAWSGEDPKYPVRAIPVELKTDVNVVFREDFMTFEIHAQNRATYRVHQAITILNANGKKYAREVLGYDKLSKITSFKGSVYDADGKLVNRLKASEIYDQSAYDGFSLYSDNRIKVADLSQGSYPYTVEYDYEIDFKFLFYIPGFAVVSEEKVSVEKSSYTLIFPPSLKPRYRTVNVDVKPLEGTTKGGSQSLIWNFENVKPIKFEMLGPSRQEIVPQIIAAPSRFEYDNYVGSMDSWVDFGRWIHTLNKGRDVLPEATKQKVRGLTAGLHTDEEKVKALYEYLQNKTRYVSIQLGIGGYQPFEASVVDQTGYGDCKALSNYMVAMLGEVGIKAHYALIRAGENAAQMNVNFPSSQFNHAIVAVPNKKDTLWLECTSQTNPFGYMGTFTGDRRALIITDNGAEVVNTIRYPVEKNVQSRTANVFLNITGDAKAEIVTMYSGLEYENDNLNFILNDQFDKQREWIEENTSIPSFDINTFSMTQRKEKVPEARVNVELSLKRLASVSGKRLFLTPNLMNRSTFIPEKNDLRKENVVLRSTYTHLDTIRYHLPEGIYPEFLPEAVHIKSRFGEYESQFVMDQNTLVYIRKLKRLKGEFPPESYQELSDFYRGINKADNTKMVFLSKT